MANFSLLATLGLNSKGYQDGIDGAETKTNGFRSALGLLGSAVAAVGLTQLAREAVDLGTKLSDVATQLKIDVEAFQTLKFAAQEAGVKMSSLERAIRNVQLRTEEAVKGNKSYSDAFDQLGIDINEFRELKVEDKFQAIADAAEDSEDEAAAFNSVARILGERSGPELTEVLDRLAREGFDEVKRAAQESNQIMDTDTVNAMDKVADELEELKTASVNLAAEIVNRLLGALEGISETLGMIKTEAESGVRALTSFGEYIGDLMKDVLNPFVSVLEGVFDALQGIGDALQFDFSSAIQHFDDAKEHFRESGQEFQNMGDNLIDSVEDFNQRSDELNEEYEGAMDGRMDNIINGFKRAFTGVVEEQEKSNDELEGDFEKTADALVNKAGEAGGDMSRNLTPNLSGAVGNANDLSGAIGGVKTKAKEAGTELVELNNKRLDGLAQEARGVQGNIEDLEGKIEDTRQKILDLNKSELDELLDEFGTTAEDMHEEIERQLRGGQVDAHELSVEEMEKLYKDALGAIRQKAREEFGDLGEGVRTAMPSDEELERMIELMGEVADESSALEKIPDTVESLREKLEEYNTELATLKTRLEEIEIESNDIVTETNQLSTALSEKAEEIRNIVIPTSTSTSSGSSSTDGSNSVFDSINTTLNESKQHLADIKTAVEGKFINQ